MALQGLVVGAAILTGCYVLLAVTVFETTMPYLHDFPIFMAVGRALLNGRELYSQVFETKPPGIFLMAAISLLVHDHWPKVFGATAVLRLFQIGSYGLLLAACVVPRITDLGKNQHRVHRFLLGVIAVFITANFAGQGMPESFGAALGAAYVASIVGLKSRPVWRRTLVSGTLLGVATAFKEPFAVSLVAAGILCCRNSSSLIPNIVLPVAMAILFGSMCLLLAGWADDYFFVYLPYMLSDRVPSHMQKPFWDALLDIGWVAGNLSKLSPLIPVTLAGLLIGSVWTSERVRQVMIRVVVVAVAVVTTMASIRIGGAYRAQYIVFAVPFLVALDFEFLRSVSHRHRHWVTSAVTALLAIAVLTLPYGNYSERTSAILHFGRDATSAAMRAEDDQARHDAWVFDQILDSCGFNTVTLLRPIDSFFYAYTRHSPLGRDFQLRSPPMNDETNGERSAVLQGLENSEVVVYGTDERALRMTTGVEHYVTVNFTETPPSCAQGFSAEGIRMAYRDTPNPSERNIRLQSLGEKYLSEGRAHDALSVFLEARDFAAAEKIAESFILEKRFSAAIEVYEQTGNEQKLIEIGKSCLRDGRYEEALQAFAAAGDTDRLRDLAARLEKLSDPNAKRLAERVHEVTQTVQSQQIN